MENHTWRYSDKTLSSQSAVRFSEKLKMFEMSTAHEAMRKICEFHQGVTSFALFGRGRLSWQLLVRLTDQYLAGLATDFLRLPNIFTDAP